MQKTDCSVIVASHRPNLIESLCKGLLQQKTSSGFRWEIIIVTDYPHGTLQQHYPDFIWLYLADISISKKRNRGVQLAQGNLLAFIDDDCIPADNWIEQGCFYLANHPEATAVEGLTTIAPDPRLPSSATREYRRLEKQGFRTNNLFFRTDHFRAIGGFDERFTVQREDIDLAFTALDKGYRYAYNRDIRVTHVFRSWEKWDLLKNCWNRRFDPLLFRKHPKQYIAMAGSPLPPTLALVLLLHVIFLLSLGKKRSPFLLAGGDALLVALLGIRRAGLRPFSFERIVNETVQIVAAPFVVIAALLYGWVGNRG
jgi:hypothetical protein